jgi:hypothetical protein
MPRKHHVRLKRTFPALLVALVLGLAVQPARAYEGVSDATSVELFHGWDKAHLTIGVKVGDSVPAYAVEGTKTAIARWQVALQQTFGSSVTLTLVTNSKAVAAADITVTLIQGNSGGVNFGGRTRCGTAKLKCNVTLGGSDQRPPIDVGRHPDLTDAELALRLAVHELGHAMGLGHAAPLESTNDAMGYGYFLEDDDVIISKCDMDGLLLVFAWVLNGTPPAMPSATSVSCV